jgi:tetratricopeptide (TPR) repeat protein
LQGQLPLALAELEQVFPPGAPVQATSAYQRTETDLAIEKGLVLMADRQPAQAAVAFQRAIEMDPGRGAAYRHLAEAYLALGRAPEAMAAAKRADELGAPPSRTDARPSVAPQIGSTPVTP